MDAEPLDFRSNPIKIVVFGGAGSTGSTLIQMAQNAESISEIVCADRDLSKTDVFTEWADWSKVSLWPIDFNIINEKQINALRGTSLVVNAATFVNRANIKIMKIAQRIGANYVGLGSENDEFPPEELSFHENFKKQHCIGMFNWGVGPGLTNLMARHLTEGLENCLIRIFVCEQTDTKEKDLFLWNIRSALNEATSPVPRFFERGNGNLELKQAFSEPEPYIFPGIGRVTCYLANENEGVTLSTLRNVWRVQTKVGGSDVERLLLCIKSLKRILKLLPSNSPPSLADKKIKEFLSTLRQIPSPTEIIKLIAKGRLKESTVALAVEVRGQNPDTEEEIFRRANWVTPGLKKVQEKFPGKTPLQVATAFMAFRAIDRMYYSKSILPGVWPPEKLSKEDRDIILTKAENILICP